MAERAERCETCRFFWQDRDLTECRRYAPRRMLVDVDTSTLEDEDSSASFRLWPSVFATDWCGEWRAITDSA